MASQGTKHYQCFDSKLPEWVDVARGAYPWVSSGVIICGGGNQILLMLLRRQREDPPGEGLSFNFNVMIIIILYN